VARFSIAQMVKVIDQKSSHHDLVGSVIVVTSANGGFFYWLRFDPSPDGGRFGEEQLQAACQLDGAEVPRTDIRITGPDHQANPNRHGAVQGS